MSEWRPVVGYEGLYEISDRGIVWSMPRGGIRTDGRRWVAAGRTLRQKLTTTGYWAVGLCRDGRVWHVQVHILVAAAFLGPRPNGMQIADNDGNARNNHFSNLRYATASSNQRDRLRHGTHTRGEKNPSAKLTAMQAEAIRSDTRRQVDIAAEYGVTQVRVSQIKRGLGWRYKRDEIDLVAETIKRLA